MSDYTDDELMDDRREMAESRLAYCDGLRGMASPDTGKINFLFTSFKPILETFL